MIIVLSMMIRSFFDASDKGGVFTWIPQSFDEFRDNIEYYVYRFAC